jgi:hypothetical protein
MKKSKRKVKRKTNGEKYMEALAILEARITKLEKDVLPIESIAKLNFGKEDILTIRTKKQLDSSVQQHITDAIGKHLGFAVATIFLANDSDLKVLSKEPK